MFTWSVDGNIDDDVTLEYRDMPAGMEFNLRPLDARAFFGKDGDTTMVGQDDSGIIKLEICTDAYIHMYMRSGPGTGNTGCLSVSLFGADKVKSLRSALVMIRKHLSK